MGCVAPSFFGGNQGRRLQRNFREAFEGMGSTNDLGTGDKVLEQTLSRAFVIADEIRRERFGDGG